ncbi:methyl-accepting chemotaxis protein [uncultured Xylophilus sp.]|uniref:methyl-accepting chemotaxis protein n=1 Tax=uncultured Xylophilus sp. TaxID=296832 RepID=UPI0025F9468D|nr:methyl-accepting chemotaxis protein [uncultured Xylophilus sp.]
MALLLLLRRFTIRLRMYGAIAIVMLLVGLLGGAGIWGMYSIQRTSETFMQSANDANETLASMRAEMSSARQAEKEMIIQYEKPAAVATARREWTAAQDRADKVGRTYVETHAGDNGAAMQRVLAQLAAYRKTFSPVADQLEKEAYDSATVANRMSQRAIGEFAKAEKEMAALQAQLRQQVDGALADQRELSRRIQLLFGGIVLLMIATVVPATILNMRSICGPLEQARQSAAAIAGGDLSQRIVVEGHDELTDLQRALEGMQGYLGTMVAQVRDSSESIAIASQEIASGNQDLSSRTEHTAGNVQQTVSSIAELSGNVQQTASSAQLANQLAASASTAAQRGGSVVQQAVSSMQDIASSSRKINDIIALIDSIAFQTNILALNAAVEAARAGEQGRGFAVVASEVRGLAQRSAQAASEIKVLIKTSVSAVDGGVRLVEDAGSAMKEIVSGVRRVGDIIGEITAAAAEQSSGIGEVGQAVHDIDRMTQQNAALVEQSAAAAESLREQAARLAGVVRQFRIEAGGEPVAAALPGRPSAVPVAVGMHTTPMLA